MRQRTGNLLDQTGIIIHGCNSLGVMGAGVAYQIKLHYNRAYHVYNKQYRRSGLKLGTNTYCAYDNVVIVNAVTQEFMGRSGKIYVDYPAIERCFLNLRKYIESNYHHDKYPTINFPLIGCGRGGGKWETVKEIIDRVLPTDTFETVLWVPDHVSTTHPNKSY